ncbi:FadR/GntR family transcriptional regulator [Rathayibacter soli]|uniref:FadR/GntR family transcriptional regulator n=1 Tax=Rathayibacter soli TaxID=3144168 RepID=UPI0027E41200|nr:FCD domain-containing protein [Glaciibacter superstes]
MREHTAVPALVAPAVSGITRLSATDTVRARIALAIELGLLAQREQLPSDAEVAAALDVSEITARRALKSLADDGVLERRRGRTGGTFVAARADASAIDAVTTYRADAAVVHRLIDRRALIECALVQRAAGTATPANLDELDRHVRAGAQAQNWTDYHAADEKFHLAVAASSGLDWALPQYHEVLYALYRYFLPYPVDYLHGANEEHAALVEALRKRDAASAVAIIEHHVRVLHETMFVGLRDSVSNRDV